MVVHQTSFKDIHIECDYNLRIMSIIFKGKKYNFNKSVILKKDKILGSEWPCVVYVCDELLAFVGRYTFDVIGVFDNIKSVMYVENTIVHTDVKKAFLIFKKLRNKYSALYNTYINNNEQSNVALFFGARQIMHNLMNELFGSYYLSNEISIHTIFSDVNFYGDYKSLLTCKNIQRLSVEDSFKYICENNLVILSKNKANFSSELINKIITYNCNYFTPQIKSNKKFVYTIRAVHRKLHNQIDFIVQMIVFLEKKFPNSTHVIHGSVKMFETDMLQEKIIQQENKIFDLILTEIKKTHFNISIINNINKIISTAIETLLDTDLYIANIGTLQHFVAFFSKASGIIHGGYNNNYFYDDQKVISGYYAPQWFGQKAVIFPENCFYYDIDRIVDKQKVDPVMVFNSNYKANISECLTFIENHEYIRNLYPS